MKKILLLTAVIMMVATAAFAESKETTVGQELSAATPANQLIAKASKGVKFGVITNATGSAYALMTYHTSGTKLYGTAYDSTKIYYLDVGPDYATSIIPATSITQTAFIDNSFNLFFKYYSMSAVALSYCEDKRQDP